MLQTKMIICILMVCGLTNYGYAVTYDKACAVLKQLETVNNLREQQLFFNNDPKPNSMTNGYRIIISQGMLNLTTVPEIATVLGHELAHAVVGRYGGSRATELRADKVGAYYTSKAGYSRCVGANVLLKLNFPASKTYPSCKDRYKALGC